MPICKECGEEKTLDEMQKTYRRRNGRTVVGRLNTCQLCMLDYRSYIRNRSREREEAAFYNQFILRRLI